VKSTIILANSTARQNHRTLLHAYKLQRIRNGLPDDAVSAASTMPLCMPATVTLQCTLRQSLLFRSPIFKKS